MEKDLEKELEEILEKHKSKEKFKGIGIAPCIDTGCGDWVTMLLALMMLGDKPIAEPKQPIINIYLGGDK